MLFHTPAFLALLAVTCLLFYTFPRRRAPVLALANMAFYGLPNPAHLGLFLAACLCTFLCAARAREKHGRLFFLLGLFANALNLVFFKYALFFTRSVEGALGVPLPALDSLLVRVVLPVGISFYTFQLVAYLVDVRRGALAPERSFLAFWVFISLFPQLVAGPIVRGGELLPQIQAMAGYRFAGRDFQRGLLLFLAGMVKKVILADSLSPYVDGLFAHGASLGGVNAWLAAYLFAFQIYFDFSAYSDMAVGSGAMLGFRLPQNFRTPYVSANPAEFWRRWHITLSNWMRDYVYIPLGGSRKGLPRQLLYLVLAMGFSGLWHGAAWTFVLWGAYHGLLAALHKLGRLSWESGRGRASPEHPLHRVLAVAVNFHLVTLGWVFFRAPDTATALAMVRRMLAPAAFTLAGVSTTALFMVVLLYLLHVAEYLVRGDGAASGLWRRVPAPVRGLAYAMAVLAVMVFTRSEQVSFIYFRF